jgi:aminoglycoside 3-N-acetyltransferase
MVSFAAYGKHAPDVISNHPLAYSLGNMSPLAKVYDLDGYVLLFGVGYGNNTSFHLSEARARGSKIYQESSPITDQNGKRTWTSYEEIDWDEEPFDRIGKDYEATGSVKRTKIGGAETRLFRQRPAVDFAVEWLEKARGY